jgi:hypothetical protein
MNGNSPRRKGSDYERELARDIEQYLGGRAWRSPSSGAMWYAKQDVVCTGNIASRFHIEAKRQERVNIEEAYGQALRGAGTDKIPVVVVRRNRDISMAYLKWVDLLTILAELQAALPQFRKVVPKREYRTGQGRTRER